ncbi:MAG: recombination protein RecR [Nitrospirae bacterium]|nr:recombination protein RecR [Nitrospirota bacterium]
MAAVKDPLRLLVELLQKVPGMGEKSATRMAYHFMKAPAQEVLGLAEALRRLKAEMRECEECCDVSFRSPCETCANPKRDPAVICVVADSSHIKPLERSGAYAGVYHVLHGTLSPMENVGPEQLRIAPLLRRIEGRPVCEVILAINPTMEGETTMLYLMDLLKDRGLRVTKLPVGLALGSDIEYTDHETLGKALRDRVQVSSRAT